jgi:cell division protease FtsH
VIGQITTGSENDLHAATGLARVMVANLGMGEAIGRVAVGQKSGEVFLGRDFTKMQEVSPATLEKVDGEIRTLLERAEAEATHLLERNRAVLERLAGALYEAESLSGSRLASLLADVRPHAEVPDGNGKATAAFLAAFTGAAAEPVRDRPPFLVGD